VAIKTNCPSLSTEEQNSEYSFHLYAHPSPPSLLNALLDLSNKDLIYLPLGFECSNSLCYHGGNITKLEKIKKKTLG
jgi:hypothetical protein